MGERGKENKCQLRDSNPGCLTVAAITTKPQATTATSLKGELREAGCCGGFEFSAYVTPPD